MSFLIIQTAFFGDVILATALVEQLAHQFPDARIDMLVQKSREVLLANNPHLHTVYTLEKDKKFKSTVSIIRKVRAIGYDYVINVHRHGTSGLITALSGAGQRIGFDAHPMSFLFDRCVNHDREGVHEVDRNYRLIEHLVDAQRTLPRLYPSDADCEKTAQDNPYVTISPASVWYTKQWPREKWIGLIDRFPGDLTIYLLGGPGDRDLCESIAAGTERRVSVRAGEYSFLESAALMSKAAMNYTNDSAPVHMASAMNAPVTTVFCSTIPAFGYGPLSERSRVIEYAGQLSCRPCGIHGHRRCPEGHFKCSQIDVEKVVEGSAFVAGDQ